MCRCGMLERAEKDDMHDDKANTYSFFTMTSSKFEILDIIIISLQ